MSTQTFCVQVPCAACQFVERIYVRPADYLDWGIRGVHAQDAFPYLSDLERDVLISNMCLDCLDEMYQDAREEEEDEYWLPEDGSAIDPESDDVTYERDWYAD